VIRRLAVIGVGLIGGSLARALREAGEVKEIVGCGRSRENLEKAVELGVIDRYSHDVGEAVKGADMIFVGVPLGAMKGVFEAMKGHLADDAVITDGGSAKGRVILTPLAGTDPDAVARVRAMWEACGAEVTEMPVEHHDEVLAATSHLPHMLAFGLVDALARMKENDEIFRYAAGGFRDFTRIASSNPVMWRDICIANAPALSHMLAAFADEMKDLAETIAAGDGDHLLEIFERAKAARDRYIDGLD